MYKILHCEDRHLQEINQTIPMLFSFASVDGETITRKHTYVKCRDFLGDVVWWNAYENVWKIYGFESNFPLETDTVLIIKFPSIKEKTHFLENVSNILNSIEKQNNLSCSKILDVSKLEVVIISDGFWQQTIQAISFFSFLLKCCAYKYKDKDLWIEELKARSGVESQYIRTVTVEKIKKLTENFTKVMLPFVNVSGFKDEQSLDMYVVHDGCGFVNSFRFNNKTNEYSKRFAEL